MRGTDSNYDLARLDLVSRADFLEKRREEFTMITDGQRMDWHARVAGRISSGGGRLRIGFLARRDIQRVFDVCFRVEPE